MKKNHGGDSGVDKNGIPLLPELLKIDLQATFDYDRHSDDGCPLMVDFDLEKTISEAEEIMKAL